MKNDKEYSKKYRAEHKEQRRKYTKENFDRIKAKRKEHRERNIEKIKEYEKKYKIRNKERINERQAIYSKLPKSKYAKYKRDALSRNLEFKVSFDEFMTFWQKPCSYCRI